MAERTLKPEVFSTEPSDPEAAKKYNHWQRCATAFLNSIDDEKKPINKLEVFVQLVDHNVYALIEDADTYDEAVNILKGAYVKTQNILYARHALINRRQKEGESLLDFLSALKGLAKPCSFVEVTALVHKEEYIREAFVSGLRNRDTKQKILESSKTKLSEIVELARIYEDARSNAEEFSSAQSLSCPITNEQKGEDISQPTAAAVRWNKPRSPGCGWCGYKFRHPKERCPARDAHCHKCGTIGHFAQVCHSSKSVSNKGSSASIAPALASISVPGCLEMSAFKVGIGGRDLSCTSTQALFDTGAGDDYIDEAAAKRLGLTVIPEQGEVGLANTGSTVKTTGYVRVTLTVHGKKYLNTKLTLFPNCVAEVVLGGKFLLQKGLVKFTVPEGVEQSKPSMVSALGTLKLSPPSLFSNLTPDCHPVISKSRRYTADDREFIKIETARLLKEGIIEPSKSPWRAQIHVAGGGNQKKRMTVDYSETINRFTLLDAYPLPRIKDHVNSIAQYNRFSDADLSEAYHQYELPEEDKPYTAFEADGGLYQFRRVPFGVTNGVACFQRAMDNFVEEYGLKGTFPYLDNITICGKTQEEHDENLNRFLAAAKKVNLTLNDSKCVFNTTKLHVLGSVVENGEIRPDPKRLAPLMELQPPTDAKSLKRILGFFSYYSKWIKDFSMKISSLVKVKSFPLTQKEVDSFIKLKNEVASSVVCAIDEDKPFTVECDASNTAIAATLNQAGRPVAFFSRTLRGSELKHASVEKEAQAIIEAVRNWRHFLTGRHFTLVTDQKSVSFMFDTKHSGKIKNEKIMRWRMDLMCYSFDIVYKPGPENIPPDTFSRGCASVVPGIYNASVVPGIAKLKELHNSLSHPGVTRMSHFIKTRNLPYSMDEIRRVNNMCKECAEVKPRFYKPDQAHLIKSTQPFERLNMDFKGPLPSTNRNRYMLHIVDEYSRFPFVFPVSDMTSSTIIRCLCTLFSMFGMPGMVHSDRGTSFLSEEVKQFLNSRGISSSRTTPYNPAGNGQVEKGNHTIWRAVTLACCSKGLPLTHWQEVLPDVLHSIRTLLCTATNSTPHERMFNFQRKSGTGTSLPTWLSSPGKVLLRRFVRHSKNEPLVDEVDLLEANPQYAHIRHADGRESTVSIKDLAPRGNVVEVSEPLEQREVEGPLESSVPTSGLTAETSVTKPAVATPAEAVLSQPPNCVEMCESNAGPAGSTTVGELRRSSRVRVAPQRLITEV